MRQCTCAPVCLPGQCAADAEEAASGHYGSWNLVFCVCLHIKVKHNMAIVLQDNSSWVCHTTDAGVHAARRACVPERLVLNVERAVVDVG